MTIRGLSSGVRNGIDLSGVSKWGTEEVQLWALIWLALIMCAPLFQIGRQDSIINLGTIRGPGADLFFYAQPIL